MGEKITFDQYPGTPTQDKADMQDPRQFAQWVFAVGTPDSRPGFPNQPPMIPKQSWPDFSQMLWDLGFRHVKSKQKKWVIPGNNWVPGRLVDKKPKPGEIDLEQAAEFLMDTNPEIADKVITSDPEQAAEHAARMRETLLKTKERAEKLKAGLNGGSTT